MTSAMHDADVIPLVINHNSWLSGLINAFTVHCLAIK